MTPQHGDTRTAVLHTWGRWQVTLRDIIDDTPVWDHFRARVAADALTWAAEQGDVLGPVYITPPRPVVVHHDFTWRPWSIIDGPEDRAVWAVVYVYVPIAVTVTTDHQEATTHA